MSIRTVTYEICGKRHSKPFSLIICFVFCETYHSGNESEYQAFVAFVLQSQGGQWRLEDGGGGRVGLPLVIASSSSHTYTLWSNQQVPIPHLLQAPQKIPMLYYTYHTLHTPKHETAAQTCEMAMKVSIFSITILSILNTKISGHPIEQQISADNNIP
jgi:hypothetical protein